MASAWGDSWGVAWGDAWGAIVAESTPGGGAGVLPSWGKSPDKDTPWLAPLFKPQPDAMSICMLAVGGGIVR